MNSSKKSTSLPNETVEYLKAWMMSPEHIAHPYPTDAEKSKIMQDTGIELKQLTNWFVNNRKRYWKPRVEAKLQEHVLSHQSPTSLPAVVTPGSTTKPKSSTQAALRLKLPRSGTILGTSLSCSKTVSPNEIDKSMGGTLQIPSDVLSAKFKRSSENGSSSSSDLSNMTEVSVTPRAQPLQTSSVSLMDSVYVSQQNSDDEDSQGQHGGRSVLKTEVLDVHILRQTGNKKQPQLSDVSILPFLPKERVAKTFKNCLISYDVSIDGDTICVSNEEIIDIISSRRESQINVIKEQCLSDYQAELEKANSDCDMKFDVINEIKMKRKRDQEQSDEIVSEPFKCRRVSVDLESRYITEELPTIEEAAQLFGFAQAIQQSTIRNEVFP